MFNLRNALHNLNGRTFSFDELKEQFKEIRRAHLNELTPELGVSELIQMARMRSWLQEDENGHIQVRSEQA